MLNKIGPYMLEFLLCFAMIGFVVAETIAPALSEVAVLRVQNAYLTAMNASAEVQRVQAAALAASPDVQRAQAAFQKTVDAYNALVIKEGKAAKLPEGATITIDPATKAVSVKLLEKK